MAPDSAKLDALAQGLNQGQVTLRPASLARAFRCTACRVHVQPGQGIFIEATLSFIVAQKLGAHLCAPCADRVRAQASALPEEP